MASNLVETRKTVGRIRSSLAYRTRRLAHAFDKRIVRLRGSALPTLRLDPALLRGVAIGSLIMDDICLPPFQGPKSHNDALPLFALAQALSPEIILELGTAHGNTVANLCRFCPRTHVYTVNAPVEEQTGALITYELTVDEIGRVYRAHGFADRVTQLYQNTLHLDLAPYLEPGSVDLAIIDACHDTEYVLNDFHKVRPYMKASGVVLLHDTHPSMAGHLEGSYRACVQLRRDGFDVRHVENTWWGIWSPSDLDERVRALGSAGHA